MVYIKEDETEEITDWYQTERDGFEGVVVETDGGYFEYWFPIDDAPDYIDGEKMLSVREEMTITEAPDGNTSVYTGRDGVNIPKKVADKAEEVTGYEIPE